MYMEKVYVVDNVQHMVAHSIYIAFHTTVYRSRVDKISILRACAHSRRNKAIEKYVFLWRRSHANKFTYLRVCNT